MESNSTPTRLEFSMLMLQDPKNKLKFGQKLQSKFFLRNLVESKPENHYFKRETAI